MCCREGAVAANYQSADGGTAGAETEASGAGLSARIFFA
jgi:hypothetical protein